MKVACRLVGQHSAVPSRDVPGQLCAMGHYMMIPWCRTKIGVESGKGEKKLNLANDGSFFRNL